MNNPTLSIVVTVTPINEGFVAEITAPDTSSAIIDGIYGDTADEAAMTAIWSAFGSEGNDWKHGF
jgi:hypothetical protein